MSCNCILGNTNTIDDLLKLNLMESYCLPILTHATVAMTLSNIQISELNDGTVYIDAHLVLISGNRRVNLSADLVD